MIYEALQRPTETYRALQRFMKPHGSPQNFPEPTEPYGAPRTLLDHPWGPRPAWRYPGPTQTPPPSLPGPPQGRPKNARGPHAIPKGFLWDPPGAHTLLKNPETYAKS